MRVTQSKLGKKKQTPKRFQAWGWGGGGPPGAPVVDPPICMQIIFNIH